METDDVSVTAARKSMYLAKAKEADEQAARVRDLVEREKWKKIAQSWRSLVEQLG
jgi:uncharacterized alpha-E superfamily protein